MIVPFLFGRADRFGQEDRKARHSLLAVLRAHSPQPGRVELHLQLLG